MTSSNLIYLEVPQAIPLLIEAGELTLEEAEAAQTLYDAFREKLDAEWPPARTKEFMLSLARAKCQFAIDKIKAIELENLDARKRGVSFKERQKFSTSIDVLRKMFEDHKKQGLEWKKLPEASFRASLYVKPLDVALIEEKGFEHHLKYLLL